MTFFYGLVIGLIVGWVIEWVIDLLFWRRDDQRMRVELAEAESKIRNLETQLDEHQMRQRQMLSAENDLRLCQDELSDAEQTIDQLRAEINSLAGKVSTDTDYLERVKGIGVVFARRLNEAGIQTFEQLAAQTPGRIREIINPEEWQKIDPESWIAQAKEFAQQNARKGA